MSSLSRREFVLQSALYGSSLWAVLNLPRPRALAAAEASTKRAVLTEAQWKTVEAITARIIPTDKDPGAIEARCVNFIDKALAHEDAAAKPLYAVGVAGVDAESKRRFEKPFVEITAGQQDEILAALEAGKAEAWPNAKIPSPQFFETVRAHTIIGFLADPKYGGNHDYAGWKTVGYPGAGHHLGGYSPAERMGKEKIKTAWGEEIG